MAATSRLLKLYPLFAWMFFQGKSEVRDHGMKVTFIIFKKKMLEWKKKIHRNFEYQVFREFYY